MARDRHGALPAKAHTSGSSANLIPLTMCTRRNLLTFPSSLAPVWFPYVSRSSVPPDIPEKSLRVWVTVGVDVQILDLDPLSSVSQSERKPA